MARVNENFLKLPGSYLFSTVARKIAAYGEEHTNADIIKMSIGDVTLPLCESVVSAMRTACDEMGRAETFHGYGPEQGYDFLREKIAEFDYKRRGVDIKTDEIFVSDGAKSDCGNIVDIFSSDNVVAVCDPVYPVYVDTNAMSGRAGDFVGGKWSKLYYMPCNAENGFLPSIPEKKVDMIYLCFPNNPTGEAASKDYLKMWVEYAHKNGSVILYDSAYEAFITEDNIPHSIYEIDGAKEVAIEFRSFSKTAGFTGTRCAYTVVPRALKVGGVCLTDLWNRRQCTKFNGVSYVIQRAAEAVYSADGQMQTRANIAYYLENAKIIRNALSDVGLTVYGGKNAPYIWAKTPNGFGSWEFFDYLLDKAQVAVTPGAGFGPSGEGYVRLTAFSSHEKTKEAMNRIRENI